jgi:uncharacterized protein with von Willebrand factor type A (vWA) domain
MRFKTQPSRERRREKQDASPDREDFDRDLRKIVEQSVSSLGEKVETLLKRRTKTAKEHDVSA